MIFISKQIISSVNVPLNNLSSVNNSTNLWNEDDFVKKVSSKFSIEFETDGVDVGANGDSVQDNPLIMAASITGMAVAGATNGIGNFIEDTMDFAVMLGSATLTVPIALADGVSYLTTGETSGAVDYLWEQTNAFVSEKHVDNVFANFFEENEFGKSMNENAASWLQYGSTGYNIAQTAGYTAGLVGTAWATGGLSVGATGANFVRVANNSLVKFGSRYAFATGNAKGATEALNTNNATIDLGKYGIVSINFSYDEISELNENGILVKDIRNGVKHTFVKNDDGSVSLINGENRFNVTIDETKTVEALRYGAVNGIWESVQWIIGGRLAGHGLLSIGGDMATGAIEVPFKSYVQGIYDNNTFEQRFENNGGAEGVLLNFSLSGALSGYGEREILARAFRNANFSQTGASIYNSVNNWLSGVTS